MSAQWPAEIKKFTKGAPGGGLKVIVIKNVTDMKKQTIEDFENADIVVIADSIFRSPLYWPML